MVDPDKAREHILSLCRSGVGKRSVADAAGVSRTIVQRIRKGDCAHIRLSTEKKILGVDANAVAGGAPVNSSSTWALLDRLLARGFSKRQLALWMGYRAPAIQLKRGAKITASNAARVRKMYELLRQGKLRRDA